MSAKIPSLPPIHSIGANFENVDARFINPKEIKLFPDSILTFQPNLVMLCVPVTFFFVVSLANLLGQGQTERKQNEIAPMPLIITGVQELSA